MFPLLFCFVRGNNVGCYLSDSIFQPSCAQKTRRYQNKALLDYFLLSENKGEIMILLPIFVWNFSSHKMMTILKFCRGIFIMKNNQKGRMFLKTQRQTANWKEKHQKLGIIIQNLFSLTKIFENWLLYEMGKFGTYTGTFGTWTFLET